jgi:hypothetical protein
MGGCYAPAVALRGGCSFPLSRCYFEENGERPPELRETILRAIELQGNRAAGRGRRAALQYAYPPYAGVRAGGEHVKRRRGLQLESLRHVTTKRRR